MKKDHNRDYATEAFRYWAAVGCPTYEDAVARLTNRANEKAKEQPTEIKAAFVDACIAQRSGALLDIKACDECFKYLRAHGKDEVCAAVRDIYMAFPRKRLARGELSGRVVRFAMENYYSSAQVYRFLADACDRFVENRGLRAFGEDDGLMLE